MLSIDGLVTGLDTTSIIEGLLEVQQRQIDVLSSRRAKVLSRQTSFSGVEARLLTLRGALGRLTSIQTTAINDKIAKSSHEDLVVAAASDDANVGVYRLRVEQLASAHQLGSDGFASRDAEIGQGSLELRVGQGHAVTVNIDETNNSVQGFVDAINNSEADVTASVINDGSAENPYRILISSNKTGTDHAVTISGTLSGVNPTFQDVQAAQNARVTFGAVDTGISVESQTNRVEELITGVTLDLKSADASQEITLTVGQDVEAATAAVQDFVDAYNEFTKYVNDQVRYNAAADLAGPLLGDRSVTSIQDDVQLALTGVVVGLDKQLNRLTAAGVTLDDRGRLNVDKSRLEQVLTGQVEGVAAQDLARLFSLSGESTRSGIDFVVGSARTAEGTVEVDITSAAERAHVTGAAVASSIVIDDTNNELQVSVDGRESSVITLSAGTYSPSEFALHIQAVINSEPDLTSRGVTVSVQDNALQIQSNVYGSSSEIKLVDGSALATMGFEADDYDRGQDVVGRFIVDGQVETATGRGNLLMGDKDNEHTGDLQVRVHLTNSDLVDGSEGSMTVTRGLAARLDQLIGDMLDDERGTVATINERFDETSASIQRSIDRLNAQFETQQESLIRQFAALESAVSELQTTGNFLATQFAGLSRF